ncbi:DUF6660 family protein [Runella slithyformis]|uniref:Uncharacterized protein n=1 Tax=Runella slithyformis (strain ATCC 29530 / DSM 19594 / LMG 11500 / NCIMB 11436 / LSU 4) TaxID=761193 RepID=A0A7U3ZIX3_RUNSL|nr:DUF6660 family protein [Runella slithyformis]AEI48060.1 hypothetical protein Runsl_1635 [Runella slithyformis DSM 19594]
MKWFSILWASYLVVLSCIPCTHHHELRVPAAGETKTISHPTAHNGETDRDEDENQHHHVCSPFCQCTCNGGFTVPTPHFVLQPLTLTSSTNTSAFSHQSSYTPSLFASIWQPPKLLMQR